MQIDNTLWEKIKSLSDEEWRGLRNRRDSLEQKAHQKPDWRSFVGYIPAEDLSQMTEAIALECERVDPDDWD
jgi:hypothetical protein